MLLKSEFPVSGNYIAVDGSSLCTAPIPFQEGLTVPDSKYIKFGSQSYKVFMRAVDVLNIPDGFGGFYDTHNFYLGADDTGSNLCPYTINIDASSSAAGTGGSVYCRGGNSGSNEGGRIWATGAGSSTGGYCFMDAGDGAGSAGGGGFLLTAGAALGTGNGGGAAFSSGGNHGTSGNAGDLTFTAGNITSGGSGNGGQVFISGGNAKTSSGGTSGSGGRVTISAGNTHNAGVCNPITLAGGTHNGSGNGGLITMRGGSTSGGNYGYTRVGNNGTPSRISLTSSGTRNSLYVEGDFEVDTAAHFDGTVNFFSTTFVQTTGSLRLLQLTGPALLKIAIDETVGTVTLSSRLTYSDPTLDVNQSAAFTWAGAHVFNSTVTIGALTGILKATAGLVATASSSDLITAIGNADDDAVTKGVSTYVDNDFNATAGVVSINQAGNFVWTGFHDFQTDTDFAAHVSFGQNFYTMSPNMGFAIGQMNNLMAGGLIGDDADVDLVTIGLNTDEFGTLFADLGYAVDTSVQGAHWKFHSRNGEYVAELVMQDNQGGLGGGQWNLIVATDLGRVGIGIGIPLGTNSFTEEVFILGYNDCPFGVQQDASASFDLQHWRNRSGDVKAYIDKDFNFYTLGNVTSDGSITALSGCTAAFFAATGTVNQYYFDSTSGSATILQDSATALRTITLPDSTTTLAGLSTTQTFSGVNTFSSTSGIILSSTSPIITFTDTSIGEDDYTISVNSSIFKVRNTTDGVDEITIDGSGNFSLTRGNVTITIADKVNISVGTGSGSSFGANSSQKIGFYGSTTTQITGSTDVLAGLVTCGLRAASSNPPLNLGTGAITCGTVTASGNVTISKAIPLIQLTDTTGSSDDYSIDVGAAATSRFRIRNTTDAATVMDVDGTNRIAFSTNYSPQAAYKVFIQDRDTAATPAQNYAALSTSFEYLPSGTTTTMGSNLHGYQGGVTAYCSNGSISGSGSFIGLRGDAQVFFGTSTTNSSNIVGLFASFSSAQLSGTGGTQSGAASAVSTYMSNGANTTVSDFAHYRVGGTSNSGTITVLYGMKIDALTAGGSNYELFFGTNGRAYYRDGNQYTYSSAASTLDDSANTTRNFRIGGTIELALTATQLDLMSATTDRVNFIGGSGAAAPGTSIGAAIVNYYGANATNFLGDPVAWLEIKANGTTRKIPLY